MYEVLIIVRSLRGHVTARSQSSAIDTNLLTAVVLCMLAEEVKKDSAQAPRGWKTGGLTQRFVASASYESPWPSSDHAR